MAITDELREYATGCFAGPANALTAIADRIDAEHRNAVQKAWNEGLTDANKNAELWHEEHGWVKLPVDADGVPIRAGDAMEERSGNTFEVGALLCYSSQNWLVLQDPRNYSTFRIPDELRHYHAPTVEDVVSDLVDHATSIGTAYANNDMDGESMLEGLKALIAEYAAKLRLAEEVDA